MRFLYVMLIAMQSLIFLLFFYALPLWADDVLLLDVKGPIGPAVGDYIIRGIEKGERTALIIIRLDTEGGLMKTTRLINEAILDSRTPVVVYVAPNGARAASAGTYMLYAAHIAAMAPATHLGAATPITMGSPWARAGKEDPALKKVRQDAIAYLKSLAELRGRNAAWAEKAITEAATLTATEALQENVIDVIAKDIDELLAKLDGKTLTAGGLSHRLKTTDLDVYPLAPNWRTQILTVITDPNIAYLLLLAGMWGIFFEMANPGVFFPGVAGVIALCLALFGLQLLPISYAALALLLFGIAFIVAEAFVPSFGALGIGGLAAFLLGSLFLMDGSPEWQISRTLIFSAGLATALLLLVTAWFVAAAWRRPKAMGEAPLKARIAIAMEDFTETGHVRLGGEIWRAQSTVPIKKGEKLKVIAEKDLILNVAPVREEKT